LPYWRSALHDLRADRRLRHERRTDAGQEHRDDHEERPSLIRSELSQRHSLLLTPYVFELPRIASAVCADERVVVGHRLDVLTSRCLMSLLVLEVRLAPGGRRVSKTHGFRMFCLGIP